jgi:hypothetical protein
MTRTGRALVTGPVVAALALWVAAAAVAAPAEPTPPGEPPSAARPAASAAAASAMLPLPALTDIVGPLVLAAICGAAMAFFSTGPRQRARARVTRRRRRS